MQVPQGHFELHRYPFLKNETLRAWDAADEYLLHGMAELEAGDKIQTGARLLVVNDSFGALSVALAGTYQVTLWSDSFLSETGTAANLKRNKITPANYQFVSSVEFLSGNFDLVLMKLPKSNALLEDQLIRLKQNIKSDSLFIAASLAKNIHTSTLAYFEKLIGKTTTSLAKKKARLIFSVPEMLESAKRSPYPRRYRLENTQYEVTNHANVFSRESLDIGTRFFLQHLPAAERYQNIIDLGCGNGLLGMMAAIKNVHASVCFTDESYMALQSARENMQANQVSNPAEYLLTDCLQGVAAESADLVLNNPPFHQQHAVGDAVAWRMFKQAAKVLRSNGELWVIGNRHLGYHIKLRKIFGNCATVASDSKFVILKSVKN